MNRKQRVGNSEQLAKTSEQRVQSRKVKPSQIKLNNVKSYNFKEVINVLDERIVTTSSILIEGFISHTIDQGQYHYDHQ